MDTDKFKSIALNMETYKKLREMSDKKFEMTKYGKDSFIFY